MNNTTSRCPFCGGKAAVRFNEEMQTVWVECFDCHAKSRTARIGKEPTFKNMDGASAYVVGAWERRADD